MAERRRTGGTRRARSPARRPVGQDEQEVFDEDTTEPASRDDHEDFEEPDEYEDFDEEDESEAAHRDEPSAAGSGGNGHRRAGRQDSSSLTARQAARTALRQMVELTRKHAESITGVERRKDGWAVTIEVIEDRRIPSSADILATYEAEVGADGELVSYRRLRRYSRGRGDYN